jgi:creatinine amidohydrolase
MEKYFMFEMTRPEIEQALAAGVDTVVVTFGSTEQHGLHLPLGTDSLWGEYLGHRVAQALGDALLAPGVRVGCSEHHLAFAGSLTLREETFAQVAADLCRSLAHHGFRNLVLSLRMAAIFARSRKPWNQSSPNCPGSI